MRGEERVEATTLRSSDEEPGRAVHPCLSRGSPTAVVDRQLRKEWFDLPTLASGTSRRGLDTASGTVEVRNECGRNLPASMLFR
jgi:hypothetical protein